MCLKLKQLHLTDTVYRDGHAHQLLCFYCKVDSYKVTRLLHQEYNPSGVWWVFDSNDDLSDD